MAELRLLLVDDQTLLVNALQTVLEMEPDLKVVGTAGNGWAAIDETRRLEPDVVLMDIQMAGGDGITGLKGIKAMRPEVKVIMLTTFEDDAYIVMSLAAGADGFLLKDIRPEEVTAVIRQVVRGYMVLPATIAQSVARHLKRLVPYLRGLSEPQAPIWERAKILSEREQEVADLVAGGLTNGEIAQRLHLTGGTVKNYVSSIYEKLGNCERTQVAALLRGERELTIGTY